MFSNLKRFTIGTLLCACLSLILTACGDYSGGGGRAGLSYQTVSGIASKGPIEGATVTVWQMVNGQKGAKLGETRSLRDGSYSLTIPATSGPVLVEVTGNSTASYLNENDPFGDRVPFLDPDPLKGFQAAVPDIATVKTIAVNPFTTVAVKIAATLNPADIQKANAMLSNLLGVDIIATLPNNIAVNQISDINNSGDKYGAYLAAIQQQVMEEGKTVAEIINSLVTPILGNAALGTAGANFLAAVNEVISNPDINPTGVTRLPGSLTIQGAISAPVPVPSTTDTPPSAPSGLSASLDNAKTVRLTWNASTDNIAVAGYTVFRNGNVIAEVKSPGYFDGSGIALASYAYTVKAFDAARNVSASSNQATIALPAVQADLSPPSTPLALVPSFTGGNSITLSWNPSTDNVGVAGYFVFRNSQKIATVSAPGYTDTPVEPNKIYRYQVQAFDAAGMHPPPGMRRPWLRLSRMPTIRSYHLYRSFAPT